MSLLSSRAWRTILPLFIVSLLPFVTSAMRTHWVLTTSPETIDDPSFMHFLEMPWPILSHMIGGSLFCLIAIVQFTPETRQALGRWHPRLGRIAILAGMTAALSGVWMVIYHPANALTLPIMSAGRFLFGLAMALSICLAMIAAGRRQFQHHRAWMMRAFALATAGATQGVLIMAHSALTGTMTAQAIALFAWVGWTINIAVVEALIVRANRLAPLRSPRTA
ncbi:DUF2306 domain-containing protein [Cognatishimia sp. WU-CL00825]|uniref:DUF2306 domain-containing protein n=1 Tax=Cognatishimia sp. WU-CL00825 TaxID=3127658 RepID=UPI003101F26A